MPGRRIAVLGTSGCGKTVVAKRLAEVLGLTYICSDAIYWGPGWTENPPEQRMAEYDRVTSGDGWTFDGNVDGLSDQKGPLILQRVDTLVWLDLPRHQVFSQVLGRSVRRAWTKEPMWHNNRESWRQSFFSRESILLWSMQTYAKRRKKYAALFADPIYAHLIRIRLTSRRQVDAWLASLSRVIP
jgi:adenylate kinase family enzyme